MEERVFPGARLVIVPETQSVQVANCSYVLSCFQNAADIVKPGAAFWPLGKAGLLSWVLSRQTPSLWQALSLELSSVAP